MSNIKEYCERMGNSIPVTTKNKIPELIKAHNVKTLLDVGCADGRFTEFLAAELPKNVKIDAIDMSPYVDYSPIKRTGKVTYAVSPFDESLLKWGKKYDCIVFSSVMHEISSYCDDENKRYSQKPIFDAIQLANKLLNPGGIAIVRDMLNPNWKTKSIPVEMNIYCASKFLDFIINCPYLKTKYDKHAESKFMAYDTHDKILFNIRNDVLMEFLMMATWGAESEEREIKERKFILKKADWKRAFKNAGLDIEHYEDTNEEYPKYFDRLVKIWEPKWKYPMTTCLMVAKKK